MEMSTDRAIETLTTERGPHFEPYGWHHWPEHPWLAYQFRRALGETQEGGGAVSECFLAASRMIPGDLESWHNEWYAVAERNRIRGNEAERDGHVHTAKNCWLRAVDYYRSAEFYLGADDPRRLETFTKCEECFQRAGAYMSPPVQRVEIPYEDGAVLYGYFLRAPYQQPRQPVLIAFGGLDSFKEELYFMVARGALARGISCLLVDGPGQGATLRREKIVTRYDYEVPVGYCIDYLATRDDVDMDRLAVSGSSLGGYYAARAACFEHRLAAAISHGAIWNIQEMWADTGDDAMSAPQVRWVFGARSMAEATQKAGDFKLEGVLGGMRCPYLIVHGGHDVLGVRQASKVYDHARESGVDVTIKFISPEETGADHCQHDNPTIGEEFMFDWLAQRFGIDQRALLTQ
jgi:FrsA-like alpha/beta hydrolase family protein